MSENLGRKEIETFCKFFNDNSKTDQAEEFSKKLKGTVCSTNKGTWISYDEQTKLMYEQDEKRLYTFMCRYLNEYGKKTKEYMKKISKKAKKHKRLNYFLRPFVPLCGEFPSIVFRLKILSPRTIASTAFISVSFTFPKTV